MTRSTDTSRVAVIVVAAGEGTRLGSDAPKAFVGLGRETILERSLRPLEDVAIRQLVLVVPEGRQGEAETLAHAVLGARVGGITVVAGGTSRQESVRAGLHALWADIEIVLVHDAARALTPVDVFRRVIDAVVQTGWGIVPALPVIDTIKSADAAALARGEIVSFHETVDRNTLAAAQTPQGFRRDILEAAYASSVEEYSDDAALLRACGHATALVRGDERSFKITTPADLERARGRSDTPTPILPRVGIGTDVHAFGGEGELWLAGLRWPEEPALSGHSDGDVVAHAIVDALLSAAGLGDIGLHFGTAQPEYAGAHGEVFLRRTGEILRDNGWEIGNVAVQFQSNRPRFSARREEAEGVVSTALGAPVSISATTTDGLGFTGRSEGVAATAVALVFRV